MTWIVVRQSKNSPGKKDATGAFVPESDLCIEALIEEHRAKVRTVDVYRDPAPLWAMLEEIVRLEGIVYCGHGWVDRRGRRGRLPSLGVIDPAVLARKIAPRVNGYLEVCLYGCAVGSGPGIGGDGGFADLLRDGLCRLGVTRCRVLAHRTTGHSTMNPFLASYEGEGSSIGGVGGRLIVSPRGPLWAAWKAQMRVSAKAGISLRHRVPFLSIPEILAEVAQ